MRATLTALVVLLAVIALDAWTAWNVPTWGWALLTIAAALGLVTDLALVWTGRRAARS